MRLFVLRQWPGHTKPIYVAVRDNILPALGYVNQQLSTRRILLDNTDQRPFQGRAARGRAARLPSPKQRAGRKRPREEERERKRQSDTEGEEGEMEDTKSEKEECLVDSKIISCTRHTRFADRSWRNDQGNLWSWAAALKVDPALATRIVEWTLDHEHARQSASLERLKTKVHAWIACWLL